MLKSVWLFLLLDLRTVNPQKCLTILFMAQWVDPEEQRSITLHQMLTLPFPKPQTLIQIVSLQSRPLASAHIPVLKPNPSHLHPQTWAWAACCPRASPRSLWCLHDLKEEWLAPTDLRCQWSPVLDRHKSPSQSQETTGTVQSSRPRYDHRLEQDRPKMVQSLHNIVVVSYTTVSQTIS